jgi:hypothetical protein
MDPNIWGPKAWFFLHTITFNYPENPSEEDKIIYSSFFNSLTNVLPCSVCANHYKENILKHPIEDNLDKKDDLVKWLIMIHNEVNESNSKPTLTVDEVLDYYREQYEIHSKLSVDKEMPVSYLTLFLLFIILCETILLFRSFNFSDFFSPK